MLSTSSFLLLAEIGGHASKSKDFALSKPVLHSSWQAKPTSCGVLKLIALIMWVYNIIYCLILYYNIIMCAPQVRIVLEVHELETH